MTLPCGITEQHMTFTNRKGLLPDDHPVKLNNNATNAAICVLTDVRILNEPRSHRNAKSCVSHGHLLLLVTSLVIQVEIEKNKKNL